MNASPAMHLLEQLVFPARYEALAARLGADLASLLVTPEIETQNLLEDAARGLMARGEGLFLPIYAPSGTGKTTLANNLDKFLPGLFLPTILFSGSVNADALQRETAQHLARFAANDQRIVPINIDHREGSPPTGEELAEIKRFLRHPGSGSKAIILWPDTQRDISEAMSRAYTDIAGRPPIDLPVAVSGPPKETWREIAKTTLRLVNFIDSLEDLGVEPNNYDPGAFTSLGGFLREISDDFAKLVTSMRREMRKSLRLAIIFASESADAGILTHLTSSNQFGLLDGSALLDSSPDSEVGKWWKSRRGLLTSTIVRLDARVFSLPPSASVGVLRRYGSEEVMENLSKLGVRLPGELEVKRNLERCDLGKYLLGQSKAILETKGTPTTTSLLAFQYLAEAGFTAGRDKALNYAMADALIAFASALDLGYTTMAERQLDFCPLIPDNSLNFEREAICLEYTWRASDFMVAKNRGNIAAYCLRKLRNYSRELGWAPE
ncbi:hypothetical protein KBZ21_04215 [Streptomyces sp. A73]|uniref:hypothetical protein n=1 Tax=Streptomyces smyrnaeus TaxID=1387713 RepID=UPI00160A55B5|nr:hypothetical protein [Streptomyces sp. A73]